MTKTFTVVLATLTTVLMLSSTDSQAQVQAGGGLVYGNMDSFDLGIQANAFFVLPAAPQVRLGGDFTYYLPQSETEAFGGSRVSGTANFFALNPVVHYTFVEADDFSAYGLGGLSLARASVSFSGGGQTVSDSNSDVGLNVGAGAGLSAGPGFVYGELKLVTGDFDRIVFGAGYRVPLD